MKDIKIVSTESLAGVRVGLYIPSQKTIYVSEAVNKLIESDLELMKKSLTVYKMPTENGQEKFSHLDDWLADLIVSGKDILIKKGNNG